MRIDILSARTGGGHTSVAKAIRDSFHTEGNLEINLFDSFYEKLSPYTAALSDFYNILQHRSKELCRQFTQLAQLEGTERQNDTYQMLLPALKKYFFSTSASSIISTTPLINRYIIRFISDHNLRKKFYIVVTDPFYPMYPGFDVPGADDYFVPNEIVAVCLKTAGISSSKIHIVGYPVQRNFLNMHSVQKSSANFVILINSGSNGYYNYISILEKIINTPPISNAKIIFLCGKNRALYKIALQRYGAFPNVEIIYYSENMAHLLSSVNVCITKPGANIVYECIHCGVPLLIDACNGYLYQESGIVSFLQKHNVGIAFSSIQTINHYLLQIYQNYEEYTSQIQAYPKLDGAQNIAQYILQQ